MTKPVTPPSSPRYPDSAIALWLTSKGGQKDRPQGGCRRENDERLIPEPEPSISLSLAFIQQNSASGGNSEFQTFGDPLR